MSAPKAGHATGRVSSGDRLREIRRCLREAWVERVLLPYEVEHLSGPVRFEQAPDELIVVSLVRNAEAYLPTFIEHYRAMGIRRLILLDNDSQDETREIAARHEAVTVLKTRVGFRGNNAAMRRYLVRRFGRRGRWVLCVDADELFDYPGSGSLPIGAFLEYLHRHGCSAVVAHQLDMFSDSCLSDQPDPPAADLKATYRWFDLSAIRRSSFGPRFDPDTQRLHGTRNVVPCPEVGWCEGGIRSTVFGLDRVWLTKCPLMLLDGRLRPIVHPHFVDRATVSDVSTVLYHFKFVGGFRGRVADAVERRQYAGDSYEYRRYAETLRERPVLTLRQASSTPLHGADQLVDLGFLHVSNAYRKWLESSDRRRSEALWPPPRR